MTTSALTRHDNQILQKLRDPESGPGTLQLLDNSLPRDPHITDESQYQLLVQKELQILQAFFAVECQKPISVPRYLECIEELNDLIKTEPNYASARNNRAQALRRLYGSGMLVRALRREDVPNSEWDEIWPISNYDPSEEEAASASSTVLADLQTTIELLTPAPFAAISPQSAKTLAKAHAQRGSLYHRTGLNLSVEGVDSRINPSWKEGRWKVEDFKERAQYDFMMSAKYGNDDAKKMLVATNPAAKLCGEIVKEAMRKELQLET
jgi:hypothetical protein